VTSLRRWWPNGLLARVRLGAMVVGSLALLGQTAQIGNSTKSADYLTLSVASLLLLTAMLIITYLRHRAQWWDVVSFPVLVVLAGSGLEDPLSSIAITLGVVVVLALYGSVRLWAVRTLGGVLAIPAAVAVSPDSYGRSLSWHSPSVIGIMPQLVLVSIIMRGLYAALQRTEEATAREEVLARSGRDMLAMTEVTEVRARGLRAAQDLAALSRGAAFVVVRRTPDGLRAISMGGLPESARGMAVPDAAISDPARLAALFPEPREWRVEEVDPDTYIAVGRQKHTPDDVFDSFSNLANQVVLAEAGCRSHAELDHRANHDPLTQLPTRTKFFRALAAAVDGSAPGEVALLNIDLDDFKQVNDSYGHAAGDELLIEVARRIAGVGGPGSLAGRFGGDEFTLLLTGLTSAEQAEQAAELLCARLVAPVPLTGVPMPVMVGASIGVAITAPGLTAGDLSRSADIAMYSAKAHGKNRVEIYHPDRHGHAAEQRTREKHLGEAVARGEIRIGYRPRVDPRTGRTTIIETHPYWAHLQFGGLAGGDLLTLAARTGNLARLGREVLQQTCAEIAGLPDGPASRFSIDLTVRQLHDPGYPAALLETLAGAGLRPDRLELIVTGSETLDMDDDSPTRRQVELLSGHGVQIALDGPQTASATLELLRAYPIHRLTVDAGDEDAADLATAVGQVLGTRLVRDGDGDTPAMTLDELATWLIRAPAAA
jgi:diguanylate cyclase (GGDEF)-like protein